MTRLTLGQVSPRFTHPWVLVRQGFIVVCVIAMGMVLAYLLLSPQIELTFSIIGVFVHFIIIWFNPLPGLLFWLVFYPFSEQVVNIPLPAGVPDLSPTRFTIFFLFTLILIQVALRKRTWPRMTKVDWATAGFAVAILLSTFASDDPLAGFQDALDIYITPLIFYFLLKNLVVDRKGLDQALGAILIVGGYSAIYIIFEQMTSYVIDFGKPPDEIITFKYSYVAYTESLRLVQGLYEGTHVFGLIFTMGLPFAFYYMFRTPSQIKKMFYVILIGLMLVGLFYTYKRAAYMSLPLSFLIIQFFYPKFRRFFFIMLVVMIPLLALTWDKINQSAVVTERLDQGDLSTGNGRDEIFAEAIQVWKQSPLLGHGFGNIKSVTSFGVTENFYLMVLVSTGLVGFIPYLLMLIFIVTDSIKLYRQVGSNPNIFIDRGLIAVFWGSAFTYVFKSFSGQQSAVMSNVLFMLIIGVVIGSQEAALALDKRK